MFAQVRDYDSSHSLGLDDDAAGDGIINALVHRAFGWAAKWDGAYFAAIAHGAGWCPDGRGLELGYDMEHHHAFFPLLPALVAALGGVGHLLGLPRSAAVILAGVVTSNVAFVLSAVALFRYGSTVLARPGQPIPEQAAVAAMLFCINPASVFMSAIYTESVFALLSISGMLLLHKPAAKRWGWRWWASALLFSGCAATRSNGVLNCGYAVFEVLHGPVVAPWVRCGRSHVGLPRSGWAQLCGELARLVGYVSLVVMPLALFQRYVVFLTPCPPARHSAHLVDAQVFVSALLPPIGYTPG